MQNTTLHKLNISGSDVSASQARVLSGNKTLRCLSAEHCKITDGGLEHLASNPQLQVLLVARNNITGSGFVALARGCSLSHLDVCCNPVLDENAGHLARIATLKTLNVADTRIGSEGFRALSETKAIEELRTSSPDVIAFIGNIGTLKKLVVEGVISAPNAELLVANRTLQNVLCDNIDYAARRILDRRKGLVFMRDEDGGEDVIEDDSESVLTARKFAYQVVESGAVFPDALPPSFFRPVTLTKGWLMRLLLYILKIRILKLLQGQQNLEKAI